MFRVYNIMFIYYFYILYYICLKGFKFNFLRKFKNVIKKPVY